jgi:FAD/FMN-containing dehydrogenase
MFGEPPTWTIPLMLTGPTTTIEALRAALPHGHALAPGDPGWDEARDGYDTAAPVQPAAIVVARSVADVQAATMFARAHALGVAPHASGHGMNAVAPLSDAILLRTSAMAGVEIDPERRVARVAAGTTWGRLAAAAGEHGLAGLAGTHDSVGVVGYTLGGGLGRLGRRYGLACNGVRAIELLAADGRFIRTDAEHEPELFWALRGGGVGLGVVTAIELELHPVRDVYAGLLVWGAESARDVLRAWRDWSRDAPRELSTTAMLAVLDGATYVVVEATWLGDEAAGAKLLAPLRELGPQVDLMSTMSAAALGGLLGEGSPVPGAKSQEHTLLGSLPDDAIDALVADSPLTFVELRRLGGALAKTPPRAGALARLDGEFSLFASGLRGAKVERHLTALLDTLAPCSSGRRYLNFMHRPGDRRDAFSREPFERLARVKAAYDPHGLFRVRHGG